MLQQRKRLPSTATAASTTTTVASTATAYINDLISIIHSLNISCSLQLRFQRTAIIGSLLPSIDGIEIPSLKTSAPNIRHHCSHPVHGGLSPSSCSWWLKSVITAVVIFMVAEVRHHCSHPVHGGLSPSSLQSSCSGDLRSVITAVTLLIWWLTSVITHCSHPVLVS